MQDQYPLEKFAIYLSPYSAHAITIDGVIYPTVEHAFQCARYDDPDVVKLVCAATSPVLAWRVSAGYKHLTVADFAERKLEIMKNLMVLKVRQHEDVRQALLDSGNLAIVKHITTGPPADGFWDDGEDGKGQNHIGRMWMEIRDELRKGNIK